MRLLRANKWELLVITTAGVILTLFIGYLLLPKPNLISSQNYSRAFFDRDGKLLRITLAADDRYRLFTPIAEVAWSMKQATILYEDHNFYSHIGVDLSAIGRAFWSTYIKQERRIGASTITMQVARLRWKLNTKTIFGKIEQIIRALQLTKHASKKDIFESYLNLVSYGVATRSHSRWRLGEQYCGRDVWHCGGDSFRGQAYPARIRAYFFAYRRTTILQQTE
ncbi:transglycosylase domain-containing protein [Pseudomonadota bacterium]